MIPSLYCPSCNKRLPYSWCGDCDCEAVIATNDRIAASKADHQNSIVPGVRRKVPRHDVIKIRSPKRKTA